MSTPLFLTKPYESHQWILRAGMTWFIVFDGFVVALQIFYLSRERSRL